MPSQRCLDSVASSPPPGNVLCSDATCAQVQASVDHHCTVLGYQPDAAWVIFVNGQWCSCCCSCYGEDTPIEASPGMFAKVQDIRSGDTVLAAGIGLQWKPVQVQFASGLHTDNPDYPVLKVVYRFNDKEVRQVHVTDDTLFLMTSGRLKTAEVLVPGDKLRRADGGEAVVLGPVTKTMAVGVHSIELGPFDGSNLDGHLLNSNGVVTADFSVQRVFGGGTFRDEGVIDEAALDPATLLAGSEEYLAKYAVTQDLLDEVSAAGIRLHPAALAPPRPLITIPEHARAFLSDDQAEDVRNRAPRFASSNTARITAAERLIEMARPECRDVVMLIDWHNRDPNAYAWTLLRQRFVVITGGLLRVKALSDAGLALIIGHILAYRAEVECVGEADAAAINVGLRSMWPQSVFPLIAQRAFEEISKLFSFVEMKHAVEDSEDRCGQPSLECRKNVYIAALAMQPLPECAGGTPRDRK